MGGLSNLGASLQIYLRRKLMSFPKVQFLKREICQNARALLFDSSNLAMSSR